MFLFIVSFCLYSIKSNLTSEFLGLTKIKTFEAVAITKSCASSPKSLRIVSVNRIIWSRPHNSDLVLNLQTFGLGDNLLLHGSIQRSILQLLELIGRKGILEIDLDRQTGIDRERRGARYNI